jgi:hypothetical protein
MSLFEDKSEIPTSWCYVDKDCPSGRRGMDVEMRWIDCQLPTAAPTTSPTIPTISPSKAPTMVRPSAVKTKFGISRQRGPVSSCECMKQTPPIASIGPYFFSKEYGMYCNIWARPRLSRPWCFVDSKCVYAKESSLFSGWFFAYCQTKLVSLPTQSPTLPKVVPPPCVDVGGLLHCGGAKDEAGNVQLVVPASARLSEQQHGSGREQVGTAPSYKLSKSRTASKHYCETLALSMMPNIGDSPKQLEVWPFVILKGSLNSRPVYVHHKSALSAATAAPQQTDYLYFYSSQARSQWMVSNKVRATNLFY